ARREVGEAQRRGARAIGDVRDVAAVGAYVGFAGAASNRQTLSVLLDAARGARARRLAHDVGEGVAPAARQDVIENERAVGHERNAPSRRERNELGTISDGLAVHRNFVDADWVVGAVAVVRERTPAARRRSKARTERALTDEREAAALAPPDAFDRGGLGGDL